MTEIAGWHWGAALGAAVAAHLGLLALFHEPPSGAAAGAGVGGIQISLGPAGAAPGGESRPVAAEATEADPVPPPEVAETRSPAEPPPVEAGPEIEPTATAEAEPASVPEPVRQAAPPPEEPVEEPPAPREVARDVERVEIPEPAVPAEGPEPVERVEAPDPVGAPEAPKAEAPEVTARAVIVPPPPPRPKPEPPVRQTAREVPEPAPTPPPRQRQAEAPAESPSGLPPGLPPESPPESPPGPAPAELAVAPGAGGQAGTEDRGKAGSGPSTAGGGVPGASADYLDALRAWLEKHKTYPRRALLRRQEGTALLFLAISREGQVLSYRIERSSGHPLLDREAEAMIERAQPLPPMPDDMRRARLELVVPVQFFLR